ncbi:hypothetical protein, partial [Salmonella enterica]|uniref:hypothetical protein n=3 Tax=Salmonella TaxID=590 RepID=UPI0039BD3D23
VVLTWRASEGAEEKSVMMTGWRDCHFTAKVSIFSGSLSTMTRSSGINARAFNFGRQKLPGRNYLTIQIMPLRTGA